jgi:hypothetical protein
MGTINKIFKFVYKNLEIAKKLIKTLMMSMAILCTVLSISGCTSVTATKAVNTTFKGPPLASASVYGMSASEYFAESEGYATLNGRQQHYYLYQWTDISDIELLTPLIGQWVYQHGYVVGEGQLFENDKNLADSVKTLMKTKNANYLVTIDGNGEKLLLYINIYNTSNNTYDTVVWPLAKTK